MSLDDHIDDWSESTKADRCPKCGISPKDDPCEHIKGEGEQ